MTTAADATSAPVTVTVTRQAPTERSPEVLAWLRAGTSLVEAFPGFLGAGWVQPGPGSQEWHVLYRFADPEALAVWETSPQRAWWLASAQGLVAQTRVEQRSGLEGWFDEPTGLSVDGPPAPPRWKQAVLIWSVFFPLNLALTVLLLPLLGAAPLAVRSLVGSLLLTPLMVYLALPLVTRRLEWWLAGRPAPWRAR